MMAEENKMSQFKIEKMVLNIGGTGEKLEKGFILLGKISGEKPIKVKATKRIPAWQVKPGLEVGTKVTLRGSEVEKLLPNLLAAIDNNIKEKQIQDNFFSFGIPEYIEIPGIDYIREVGIMGFEVTVVFSRAGKSVEKKKVKRGKTRRLTVSKEEIINFLENKYGTTIVRKKVRSN